MDLTKLRNDKKLELCKWYFKVGCLLLPFVWTVNTFWFFHDAFSKPPYEEQKEIKKYVFLSGLGSLVFGVALISWVVVYQVYRESWGATGDAISFIIPRGRA